MEGWKLKTTQRVTLVILVFLCVSYVYVHENPSAQIDISSWMWEK